MCALCLLAFLFLLCFGVGGGREGSKATSRFGFRVQDYGVKDVVATGFGALVIPFFCSYSFAAGGGGGWGGGE